jgi:hypothetical protein
MEDEKAIDKIVLTRLMHLNAPILGVVTGLVLGGVIFVATIFLLIKGGEVVGPHLALLGQFFIGYSVTLGGSFIGLAYGFVTGFIIGCVVAVLYNWLANIREKRRSSRG